MARRHSKEGGNHLDQESNRQKTAADIDGRLHPAVDGQSLGDGGLHPAVDGQSLGDGGLHPAVDGQSLGDGGLHPAVDGQSLGDGGLYPAVDGQSLGKRRKAIGYLKINCSGFFVLFFSFCLERG